METIPIGADYEVSLEGVRDARTGDYLNAGTATWTLTTEAGAAVAGGTGSLAYVSASDGDYAGVIGGAVTATLTRGARYAVAIAFSQGDYRDARRLVAPAGYRAAR